MPISQEILKITNFYLSFKITNFITTALSHAEQQGVERMDAWEIWNKDKSLFQPE